MQHFLNFFPEPEGHRSFGPIFAPPAEAGVLRFAVGNSCTSMVSKPPCLVAVATVASAQIVKLTTHLDGGGK